MRFLIRNFLVVFALLFGAIYPAGADQVDDGLAAPKRGDYAEAVDPLDARRDLRWLRRSAEYAVITQRLFNGAKAVIGRLTAARANPIPWVVSIDADETILDNSQFEVEQVKAGQTTFDPEAWRAWVEREEAAAVPGVVDFLLTVLSSGGRIAVITNRDAEQNDHTRNNLKAIGLDFPAHALCVLGRSAIDRQATSPEEWAQYGYKNDKDRRRRLVRRGLANACWDHLQEGDQQDQAKATWNKPHEILMSVGDNIRDLPKIDADAANSSALLRELAKNNGYVILPNPTYGSWMKRQDPRTP